MSKKNLIRAALNRLTEYFGELLIANSPATNEALRDLEQVVGTLPQDFVHFLAECDGLWVKSNGGERELRLWGIQEILSLVVNPAGPDISGDFLPVFGDPTSERDWLIIDEEPIGGAIMRWDPWLPFPELIGSSFAAYLGSWVEYLLQTRMRDGRRRPGITKRITFDAQFCEYHDAQLRSLRKDARTGAWLKGVAQAVACGDDYE